MGYRSKADKWKCLDCAMVKKNHKAPAYPSCANPKLQKRLGVTFYAVHKLDKCPGFVGK